MSIKNKHTQKKIGVILMTYGSPESIEDIPAYLSRIYQGKQVKKNIIDEFIRRYVEIGMSPLVKITKNQARDLERILTKDQKDTHFEVLSGMRYSMPFISDSVLQLAKKSDHIIGLVLSPQFSPLIMNGYVTALTKACQDSGNIPLTIIKDWSDNTLFLQALKKSIDEVLIKLPENEQKRIPILFTAHSMPKRVVATEHGYIRSLFETAHNVARLMGIPKTRYQFCYQSAGHTPEEWLKPDFEELMPILQKQGHKYVLIAPVQFLADHLETLYDIDIAARKQAEEYGLHFLRAKSLNTSPVFIQALSSIVENASMAL